MHIISCKDSQACSNVLMKAFSIRCFKKNHTNPFLFYFYTDRLVINALGQFYETTNQITLVKNKCVVRISLGLPKQNKHVLSFHFTNLPPLPEKVNGSPPGCKGCPSHCLWYSYPTIKIYSINSCREVRADLFSSYVSMTFNGIQPTLHEIDIMMYVEFCLSR